MSKPEMPRDVALNEAPMLGDHLALDLLNTEARGDGALLDYWRHADDVLRWLERHAGQAAAAAQAAAGAELLEQARALRALARRLIVERKRGQEGDVEALNQYLDAYLSAPHLARDGAGKLTLSRRARGTAVASVLGPVAEAVAQLLADGDFALVRQCEHPDCVLWFYDRTKAHKRRWCSMALCGNRYKAAQFRKKSGGAAA